MKVLDIRQKIVDFEGQVVLDGLDGSELTVRKLLRLYVGGYVPPQGSPRGVEEAIIAGAVAMKIHNASDTMLELTEEEYEVVKKTIQEVKHGSWVYTQMHDVVMKANKAEEK